MGCGDAQASVLRLEDILSDNSREAMDSRRGEKRQHRLSHRAARSAWAVGRVSRWKHSVRGGAEGGEAEASSRCPAGCLDVILMVTGAGRSPQRVQGEKLLG